MPRRSTQLSSSIRAPRDPQIYMCQLCQRVHALRRCPRFLNMTTNERIRCARRHKYCPNCLARSHDDARQCSSPETCRKCQQPHHTLLHRSIASEDTAPAQLPRESHRTALTQINRFIRELELPSSIQAPRYPQIYMCQLCQRSHALRRCPQFFNMTTNERIRCVQRHKYCPNCLSRHHDNLRQCSSTETCHTCQQRHHTLLHRSPASEDPAPDQVPPETLLAACAKIDRVIRDLKQLRDRVAPLQGRRDD